VINDVYHAPMIEMRTTFRVIPQSFTISGGSGCFEKRGKWPTYMIEGDLHCRLGNSCLHVLLVGSIFFIYTTLENIFVKNTLECLDGMYLHPHNFPFYWKEVGVLWLSSVPTVFMCVCHKV